MISSSLDIDATTTTRTEIKTPKMVAQDSPGDRLTLPPDVRAADEARFEQVVNKRAAARRLDELHDQVILLYIEIQNDVPRSNRHRKIDLALELSLPAVNVYHTHGVPCADSVQFRRRRGAGALFDPLE
jgi:hypothetical protein